MEINNQQSVGVIDVNWGFRVSEKISMIRRKRIVEQLKFVFNSDSGTLDFFCRYQKRTEKKKWRQIFQDFIIANEKMISFGNAEEILFFSFEKRNIGQDYSMHRRGSGEGGLWVACMFSFPLHLLREISSTSWTA